MAEFALVLPIFLLILFGIIDGGQMIFVSNQLSEAAREGARWGSIQDASTTSAGRDSIDDRVIGILNGVPDTAVTISCERDESTIPDCRFGDILVVRVESDFQFATPFLGGLMGDYHPLGRIESGGASVSRSEDPRGQILVIVAGGLVILLLAVGLVIDTGLSFVVRRDAQNVGDLASLAGTKVVADHYTDGGRTGAQVYAAVQSQRGE